MRRSPVYDLLADEGARFTELDGFEIAAGFSTMKDEYTTVRESVGLSDCSHILRFSGNVDDAVYGLDETLTGNVANIRYGRVLHTLLLDEAGYEMADVYVACDDEDLLVLCETCAPRDEIERLILGSGTPLSNVSDETAVFSLDGPRAWEVVSDLFSREVLGMPYLSVEDYEIEGTSVRLIRAGKTSEFGYLMVVPSSDAVQVWNTLSDRGAAYSLGLCGRDAMDLLMLDGRFHNANREGRVVRDPLAMGLQWMFDFDKAGFVGRKAVMERRKVGVDRKVIGMLFDEDAGIRPKDAVLCRGEPVGEVVNCGFSYTLNRGIALAIIEWGTAYSGVDFLVRSRDGEVSATSASMPPFVPKSLLVKFDEV